VSTPIPPDDSRDESREERLDRNTVELLNELRVAGAGIQILFGFLLIVPFNARFSRLSGFDRGLYIVALVCVAIATVLLIAPTVQHRLLFHLGQKPFLVSTGTRLMVIACVFLGVGLADIVLLVVKVVIGLAPAVLLAGLMAALIGGLWFALPLLRRQALSEER
jgi:hypothetical protein